MTSFINTFFKIGLSKFIVIIFGLTTSIIIARILGPEKNGHIAILLVYPSLFMTFGSLGISQSLTYFVGKNIYNEEKIKIAITQIWIFSSTISIISCIILIYAFNNSTNSLILITLALIPIPFTLFNTYNMGLYLGKNQINKYNQINWIPSIIIFILTIVFIYFLKLDIEGAMLASLGGPILMSIILILKNDFLNYISFKIEWEIIKSLLKLGLIYALSLLVINLNYKIDIILIDKLSNSYQLGIYSKGAALTQYLWQIPMLLSTLVFSKSATSKKDKDFSLKVTQLLRISILIITIICIILLFFSKDIILTLFGQQYKESVSVLNYLLPGVLLLTIFKVMNMDLAGKGKPWIALKAMIPALILNIILNLFLIPKFGANGAAISSTFSYTFAAILFVYFYSSFTKISFKEIFSYSKKDFKPFITLYRKILKK
jgi:O-antigen/teichoic acid export membrane protein